MGCQRSRGKVTDADICRRMDPAGRSAGWAVAIAARGSRSG